MVFPPLAELELLAWPLARLAGASLAVEPPRTCCVSGGDAADEPRGVSTAVTADIATGNPCSTPPKSPVGAVGDATGSVGGAIGTAGSESGGTGGTGGLSASCVRDSAPKLSSPVGGRGPRAQ